jgi:hypothetical protein
VARIVPNLAGFVDGDPVGDPDRTVDTTKYFTWLPGERTTRLLWDPYRGEVREFRGRSPEFTGNPSDNGFNFPAGYPLADLSARYKTWQFEVTGKKFWHRLPNNTRYRR